MVIGIGLWLRLVLGLEVRVRVRVRARVTVGFRNVSLLVPFCLESNWWDIFFRMSEREEGILLDCASLFLYSGWSIIILFSLGYIYVCFIFDYSWGYISFFIGVYLTNRSNVPRRTDDLTWHSIHYSCLPIRCRW